MTLSTDIYFTAPVDPMVVHRKACEVLDIDPDTALMEVKDGGIWNSPGQGFDAWVMTNTSDGTRPSYDPETSDYDDEEDHERWTPPAHFVRLDLDTAYGYRKGDLDCSTLHARAIVLLNEWAESELSQTLLWKNEYAGTIHSATDTQALARFCGNGEEAGEWFSSIVVPAFNRLLSTD